MKYLFILICIIGITSCKEDQGIPSKLPAANESLKRANEANAVSKIDTNRQNINTYLDDIKAFSNSENGNPIDSFQIAAQETAVQKIEMTKDNFSKSIKTATNYKHIFITVGNHTVVKIDDVNNCKISASWATCVPYAYGYIKKGEMIYKEDYANNIIGLPDDQIRFMYLFN